jgi:hypothetical protein
MMDKHAKYSAGRVVYTANGPVRMANRRAPAGRSSYNCLIAWAVILPIVGVILYALLGG